MSTLNIDLQEGFKKDLVVVHINGAETFRKKGVQTKKLLGYAETLTATVAQSPANVEIVLPQRAITSTFEVDLSQAAYIGVSVINAKIEWLVSEKPFGYG